MERVIIASTIEQYAELERKSPSQYLRKSITDSSVGCSKCVGCCRYYGPPGFLTQEQRKQHDCIKKAATIICLSQSGKKGRYQYELFHVADYSKI